MKIRYAITLVILCVLLTNHDVQNYQINKEQVRRQTVVIVEVARQKVNEICITMQDAQLETQTKNIIYQKFQEVSSLDDRFVGFITMLDGMITGDG